MCFSICRSLPYLAMAIASLVCIGDIFPGSAQKLQSSRFKRLPLQQLGKSSVRSARSAVSSIESLTGCVMGAPAGAWTTDGQYHVIARGCTNNQILYKKWSGSSWGPWQPLAGCTLAQPSLTARGNKLWLYVLGCSNTIQGSVSTNSGQAWSAWEDIGGNSTTNPAIAWRDDAEQNLDVFIRAADNTLTRKARTPSGWSNWQSLGGCLKSGPSAASPRNGRVDVVYIGCDDGVYHTYAQNGVNWSSVIKIGETSPTVTPSAVWSNTQLNVYIQATDKSIWEKNWDGKQWGMWTSLGGCTNSAVSATPALVAGKVDLATTGCDNAAWHAVLQLSSGNVSPLASQGQWSPVTNWPVVTIHSSLLPNGKVLTWDSVNDDQPSWWNSSNSDKTTRVDLWNPATNQHTWVNQTQNGNMFCAGTATLPDGRLLVAGGNLGEGIPQRFTNIFNFATATWSIGNLLNQARWYGTVTPLNNGEMLMMGGGASTPEVFGLNGAWRLVNNVSGGSYGDIYPWTQQAPNGQVFYAGPSTLLSYINPVGAGSATDLGSRDGVYRDYGSYATYGIGKMLIAGGESSLKTAYTIDYANGTPQVNPTQSMAYGRRQHNLTLLANGEAIATGGLSNGATLVAVNAAVYPAEIWNAVTGQWRTVASMSVARQYHSSALLLPDGRLMSGGGGVCGEDCINAGYQERNVEFYSPPYLYRTDGSLASRPSVTTLPTQLNYGANFSVPFSNVETIAKVHLIRPGSVTHSVNQEQQLVPLSFTQSGETLNVTAPTNANLAPPGYYVLYVVDSQGVPSVGKFVRIGSVTPTFRTVRKSVLSQAGKQRAFPPDGQADNTGAALLSKKLLSGKNLIFTTSALRKNGVALNWWAYGAKKIRSFKLYRSKTSLFKSAMLLTKKPIAVIPNSQKVYGFSDLAARPGTHFMYWLEVKDLKGTTQLIGPLQPDAKPSQPKPLSSADGHHHDHHDHG